MSRSNINRQWQHAEEFIEKIRRLPELHNNLTPLRDKVDHLLKEVRRQGQRPIRFSHVDIPRKSPEDKCCMICHEDMETIPKFMPMESWKTSHFPVETSCGHFYGGICLWIWLEDAPIPSCPLCRFDFRIVSENCKTGWQTMEELWQWWYTEQRKRACIHNCPEKLDDDLWRNGSLTDIRMRLQMQDSFPIDAEQWIYMLLHLNLAFDVGHGMPVEELALHLRRAPMVIEGLYAHSDDPQLKSKVGNILSSARKFNTTEWDFRLKNKVCTAWREFLGYMVGSFEADLQSARKALRYTGERQEALLDGEFINKITLDSVLEPCARNHEIVARPSTRIFWSSLEQLRGKLATLATDSVDQEHYRDHSERFCVLTLRSLIYEQHGVVEACDNLSLLLRTPGEAWPLRRYLEVRARTCSRIFKHFERHNYLDASLSHRDLLVEGHNFMHGIIKKLREVRKKEGKDITRLLDQETQFWQEEKPFLSEEMQDPDELIQDLEEESQPLEQRQQQIVEYIRQAREAHGLLDPAEAPRYSPEMQLD